MRFITRFRNCSIIFLAIGAITFFQLGCDADPNPNPEPTPTVPAPQCEFRNEPCASLLIALQDDLAVTIAEGSKYTLFELMVISTLVGEDTTSILLRETLEFSQSLSARCPMHREYILHDIPKVPVPPKKRVEGTWFSTYEDTDDLGYQADLTRWDNYTRDAGDQLHQAIDAHRYDLQSGVSKVIEVVISHGGRPRDYAPYGNWVDGNHLYPIVSLSRKSLIRSLWFRVMQSACEWLFIDLSCYSGLSVDYFAEVNKPARCGRAAFDGNSAFSEAPSDQSGWTDDSARVLDLLSTADFVGKPVASILPTLSGGVTTGTPKQYTDDGRGYQCP